MVIKFVLGAAIQFAPGIQSVDWQFSQWDMTASQVLAASKGSVTAYTNPDHNRGDSFVKLAGNYNAAGFEFTAFFSFDKQDHLTYVELDPLHQGQCDDLLQKLQRNYGPTARSDAGFEWADAQNHNKIFLFYVGDSCSLTYSPLNRAGSGGL